MLGHLGVDVSDEALRQLRTGWFGGSSAPRYWLTRFVVLRGLGLVYLVAFLVLTQQGEGLIGSDGLLPADRFLQQVRENQSWPRALWQLPTLFWLDASNPMLSAMTGVGVTLSVALLLGFGNSVLLAALWALYLSFVHIGQTFYGYGWEILLLECGFLAVFLAPPLDPRPLSSQSPPPVVIGLLRWTLFRVMFGAGLIKLRGDPCWTELTCLVYHYETQPIPSPLSWWLHHLPRWAHQAGVLFNHFAELVVPWGVFGPRRVRHIAGAVLMAFQVLLILSGNLSFLNWLTLVLCVACFDDGLLQRLFPRRILARAREQAEQAGLGKPRRIVLGVLTVGVGLLSLNPIVNMLSPRQQMNTSFDPLHLVNTYGAFGGVSRTRYEVVIEGTRAEELGPEVTWHEYEFPCKPGDITRSPCLITPYHHRLDWQMWFAALGSYRSEPWIVRLVYKLLQGEPAVLQLIEHNPFPTRPPRHVRALLYRYEFTDPGEPSWYERHLIGEYLPPLSLQDPALRTFLEQRGWLDQ